jgi:hypothetical protein
MSSRQAPILLLLTLAACVTLDNPLRSAPRTVNVSPRYDGRQVGQIVKAFDVWREESAGAINLQLANGEADATLHWGFYPGTDDACRARRSTAEGWANPDAFDDERMLYRCVMLMIARMHKVEPSERGVLNRRLDTDEFTEEDRATCRAAGVCP